MSQSMVIPRDILSHCEADLLTPTRVHRLREFADVSAEVWVKREDESGFVLSGCKKRKYASLLPYLRTQGREVIVIGGANSNHVVAFCSLLREAGLPCRLFLKTGHASATSGNGLLRHLLTDEAEIRWVSPQDWPQVEALAQMECPDSLIIPEGGTHPAALPGACTLWLDILRNERDIDVTFDHIFIDSGTALVAGTLLGMKQWHRPTTMLHVVLTAGDEAFFHTQYARFQQWAQDLWENSFLPATHFTLHRPATARSFGSVNATILAETKRLAQTHGLITDPVYTTKLFFTARKVMEADRMTGRVLVVHSGGGAGLMGFGERLGAK